MGSQLLAQAAEAAVEPASPAGVATIVVAGGVCLAVIVALAVGLPMLASVKRRQAVEESRRTLAAFVAEGSITPETAEMLMNADPPDGGEAIRVRTRRSVGHGRAWREGAAGDADGGDG